MLISALLASVLCVSVATAVIAQGVHLVRSSSRVHRESEQALVRDCLANVDHTIDLRDGAARRPLGPRTGLAGIHPRPA